MALEVLAIHYTLPPHGFPEQETLQILSGAFCSAVEMNEDLGLQDGMLQPLLQNVPGEDELLGCKSLSLILFYRDIWGILWCLLVLTLSALQTSPNRISNKLSPNLHKCKWMANHSKAKYDIIIHNADYIILLYYICIVLYQEKNRASNIHLPSSSQSKCLLVLVRSSKNVLRPGHVWSPRPARKQAWTARKWRAWPQPQRPQQSGRACPKRIVLELKTGHPKQGGVTLCHSSNVKPIPESNLQYLQGASMWWKWCKTLLRWTPRSVAIPRSKRFSDRTTPNSVHSIWLQSKPQIQRNWKPESDEAIKCLFPTSFIS